MATVDKIPSFEKIPYLLGYMVLENDQILASSGELENNEEVSKLAYKIALNAGKVSVNPSKKESFKRITMVVEDNYVFMITISNHKIYVVKRKYVNDENQGL